MLRFNKLVGFNCRFLLFYLGGKNHVHNLGKRKETEGKDGIRINQATNSDWFKRKVNS
jgi:hypothetical protein